MATQETSCRKGWKGFLGFMDCFQRGRACVHHIVYYRIFAINFQWPLGSKKAGTKLCIKESMTLDISVYKVQPLGPVSHSVEGTG